MQVIRINDTNDSKLDIFTRLREPQLKTLFEPEPGIFIAESINVILRALGAGYEPLSLLVDEKILSDAQVCEICEKLDSARIYVVDEKLLKNITGSELTGGIMCSMRRKMLSSPRDILKDAKRIAVLERVMNPTNVGAIIRSAAAMNIDAVLLTSDCSDPLYRRAARVSMGTVFQIPWTFTDSVLKIRDYGFKLASLALTDQAIDIDDPGLKTEEQLAIVLGSEHDGLLPETISGSDYVVKIPMRESVDSLNVAAASAVAFWVLRANCKNKNPLI